MTLTKTVIILATAGFLAACEEGMSTGGGMTAGGEMDESLIRDSRLAGKLDGASASGNTVSYSYFTDVVKNGPVLGGADNYCGGAGQAVLNQEGLGVVEGTKNGRVYNTMTFICR